jgi:hypothetical protein
MTSLNTGGFFFVVTVLFIIYEKSDKNDGI